MEVSNALVSRLVTLVCLNAPSSFLLSSYITTALQLWDILSGVMASNALKKLPVFQNK
jgi:hypothetical protein